MTFANSHRRIAVILLAGVAAQALHWLITPMAHPAASAARTIAVWSQAIIAAGATIWASRRT